jgi:hypothetical protein
MTAEELSAEEKAELRRVADITFDAILAAHEKFSKLEAEEANRAPA